MQKKLNNRLQAVADMIEDGVNVVDVGTDHGLLPIYLALNKDCDRIIATDINPQPLSRARAAVFEEELDYLIELRLTDGLNGIRSDEADVIVIAGLGGDVILNIIRSTDWLKNPDKALILQPMTKIEKVRKYLTDNLFEIECEEAVRDAEHLYTVMKVRYTGELRTYPPYYPYVGELEHNPSREAREYILKQAQRLAVISSGMERGNEDEERIKPYRVLEQSIRRLIAEREAKNEAE